MERWVDIKGFEDLYMISNKGRVMSKKTGLIHKQRLNVDGYVKITLTRNSKAKDFRAHRLVAQHFIPNPQDKETVNHIDGDKTNNYDSNLEWATREENMQHAYGLGLKKPMQGTLQKNSVFTEDEIKYIRSVYKPRCKQFGMRALAKKYGVSTSTIEKIGLGKSYKNINQ